MRIEKNFYDIMLQEIEELELEIAQEEALLTESERKLHEQQRTLEAEHIIQLAQAKEKNTWHIYNKKRKESFDHLYKQVLLFAEKYSINILIESNDRIGKIKLSAPFIHYGVFSSAQDKQILLELISHSDSFMMHADSNMLQLVFDYELTTIIQK